MQRVAQGGPVLTPMRSTNTVQCLDRHVADRKNTTHCSECTRHQRPRHSVMQWYIQSPYLYQGPWSPEAKAAKRTKRVSVPVLLTWVGDSTTVVEPAKSTHFQGLTQNIHCRTEQQRLHPARHSGNQSPQGQHCVATMLCKTNVQLRLGRRPEYLGRDEKPDTPTPSPSLSPPLPTRHTHNPSIRNGDASAGGWAGKTQNPNHDARRREKTTNTQAQKRSPY